MAVQPQMPAAYNPLGSFFEGAKVGSGLAERRELSQARQAQASLDAFKLQQATLLAPLQGDLLNAQIQNEQARTALSIAQEAQLTKKNTVDFARSAGLANRLQSINVQQSGASFQNELASAVADYPDLFADPNLRAGIEASVKQKGLGNTNWLEANQMKAELFQKANPDVPVTFADSGYFREDVAQKARLTVTEDANQALVNADKAGLNPDQVVIKRGNVTTTLKAPEQPKPIQPTELSKELYEYRVLQKKASANPNDAVAQKDMLAYSTAFQAKHKTDPDQVVTDGGLVVGANTALGLKIGKDKIQIEQGMTAVNELQRLIDENPYAVGVVGVAQETAANALDIAYPGAGGGFKAVFDTRKKTGQVREMLLRSMTSDDRISNADRPRIEELLPSGKKFTGITEAQSTIDELRKLQINNYDILNERLGISPVGRMTNVELLNGFKSGKIPESIALSALAINYPEHYKKFVIGTRKLGK